MSPYGDDSIEPEGAEEIDGVEPGEEEADDGEGSSRGIGDLRTLHQKSSGGI